MDFEIPEEYRMLIDSVRQFRERELMPLEHQFLMDGEIDTATWIALQEKGRELGFWALDVPEADGGQGLGEFAMCLIAEELYKHPMMFEFGGSPEPSVYLATPEQKVKYFDGVVNGTMRSCYAFTEPDTGSDLGAIRTRADLDGDHYVINGRKTFISHVERANYLILFAKTDPSAGSRGVSAFFVDMDTPGFELSRPIPTMGDGWTPYEISFENCRVPATNLLGEVGGGWAIANHQLTHGRLRIAAYQLGIAQRSLDLAIEWAKSRHTWGKPIASRQGVQWMVADAHVELEAARMLVYRAAWLTDQGLDHKAAQHQAFLAKLYAAEMSNRVTDRALQIFGGMGYSKELPVQSFFRQARLWRIGHGTSEVHRMMIARDLLGEAASA